MNQNELFYSLLRLSLGIAHDFPADVSADTWQRLYEMSAMQSLVGVCYQGVCQLPPAQQPPIQLAMQWACEAEAIRGMNIQQNEEAARLTQLFAAEGRKTAILKGQANARLYPDKLSRTPGDIDIWVEGGPESVIALLNKMGMIDFVDKNSPEYKTYVCYHHIELPHKDGDGIVEVHVRPTSRVSNPITNFRTQKWLEQEIRSVTMTDEGFCVPSMRFALIMQLTHVRSHLVGGGIGLRQLIDYYWLLRNTSTDDLEVVKSQLRRLGLVSTARALMWVLQEVLHLEKLQMISAPEERWGEWVLDDITTGGNFGRFREHDEKQLWLSRLMIIRHRIQLIHFDIWGGIEKELRFWFYVIKTIPTRIWKRHLFLINAQF